jgi:hypothetical protein
MKGEDEINRVTLRKFQTWQTKYRDNHMLILISPITFILAFIFYIAADFVQKKLWVKFCQYMAVILFVITALALFQNVGAKVIAGRMGYQAMLVTSVTCHVEKLLKKGDYQKAEIILNKFNANYQIYSDSKSLKNFITSMDIPLFDCEIEESEEKLPKSKQ